MRTHDTLRTERRPLAALALGVALLATTFAPVQASDVGAGCGTPENKTYTGAASCHFYFRGFPITAFADAAVSSGDAEVHVWVAAEEADGVQVVLVECRAKAARYATCSRGLPDETSPILDHALLAQRSLRCYVRSVGTGIYRCVSGSGR